MEKFPECKRIFQRILERSKLSGTLEVSRERDCVRSSRSFQSTLEIFRDKRVSVDFKHLCMLQSCLDSKEILDQQQQSIRSNLPTLCAPTGANHEVKQKYISFLYNFLFSVEFNLMEQFCRYKIVPLCMIFFCACVNFGNIQ